MKTLLTLVCVLVITSVAWADKPTQTIENPTDRDQCPLGSVAYDWHFSNSDWGFTTGPCDDGGVPTWEFGVGDQGYTVWGTTIGGDYPNDAGDSLTSPSFVVDESAYLVEVFHAYNIENSYDGGNVSVNGVVIEPIDGYPDDEISDSTSYYAWCVDGEPGFTGTGFSGFSCFDLSAFMGEEVQISFNFGSDSSVTYPGWYIGYVKVGADVIATDGTTWSAVKGLYR
jgi:hypothetical protein